MLINKIKTLFKPQSLLSTQRRLYQKVHLPDSIKGEQIKEKKYFDKVLFNEEGKYLIMHHDGAAFYYKINMAFLALFLGTAIYNYKVNKEVFFDNVWIGKTYIGALSLGIFGVWLFSNRHIKRIYLLSKQQSAL